MESTYAANAKDRQSGNYSGADAARDTGNLPRQLYSTLEGQAKTEEILHGVLMRLRGPGAPSAAMPVGQVEPDDVMALAQRTTQRSNNIAELVSELSNYI